LPESPTMPDFAKNKRHWCLKEILPLAIRTPALLPTERDQTVILKFDNRTIGLFSPKLFMWVIINSNWIWNRREKVASSPIWKFYGPEESASGTQHHIDSPDKYKWDLDSQWSHSGARKRTKDKLSR
jgi:hypothetical protein